jgi:hypothetical protein
MPSLDYTGKALRYVRAVQSGKRKAGRFERLACQRMLDDLENQKPKNWPSIMTRRGRTMYAPSLSA